VVQWLPRSFSRFPLDEDVDTTLHVVLVAPFNALMVKDMAKFPNSVPRIVGLDVINDVVVYNDFFIFVVDKALNLMCSGCFLNRSWQGGC